MCCFLLVRDRTCTCCRLAAVNTVVTCRICGSFNAKRPSVLRIIETYVAVTDSLVRVGVGCEVFGVFNSFGPTVPCPVRCRYVA